MTTKTSNGGKTSHSRSFSEWVVAGFGGLFVVGAVGYLLYFQFSTSSRPPQIKVIVRNVERSGDLYLVSFDVRNDSPRTAASLRVTGQLSENGTVERNTVVFDYLPALSSRHGGLFFRNDPRKGELVIAPLSFVSP